MAKHSYSSDVDQYDPKIFRESIGSFGTTTKPGGNQLQELQAKVRQGVKHVELHLASTGKGQFNVQDVPDKYGFEQRRTIMQLAKLNKQTLSVHGTFDITSFSGIGQNGFDESQRLNSIKEIDETLKFASETAKGGAVVFHIQGDPISTDRGELNLSKSYLDWLQKNNPDEYNKIQKEYFDPNYLKRKFVNNPENEKEVREEFKSLIDRNSSNFNPEKYRKYQEKARTTPDNREAWEYYYMDKYIDKQKLAPDRNPLVMVGDKIEQTQRNQELVDIAVLAGKAKTRLNDYEKQKLKQIGIDVEHELDVESFQKAQAIFSNDLPKEYSSVLSPAEFIHLKEKLLITYDKLFAKNNYMQSQTDKEFHQKLLTTQLEITNLQKKDLNTKYEIHKTEIERIKKLEEEQRNLLKKIDTIDHSDVGKAAKDAVRQDLFMKNREIEQLIYQVGQMNYQELRNYHENISQLNYKKRELQKQRDNVKSLTDVSFEKNTSAMAHLGIKAMNYQLSMYDKSKVAKDKLAELNSIIDSKKKQMDNATDPKVIDKLNYEIQKLKYERREWVGVKDYDDINMIEKPLYLAPENMLPGYGSLTSLEEYKAVMRMSQEEFVKKILSDETEYKNLREKYEREVLGGRKLDEKSAKELAKRHLSGTFDNAHAAVWLKHFKREEGESEEHRIERFNKWLNGQAEEMAKEGLIKHIHFNDTQAKDDDHNLLGSGILDLHDMRERLRRAGIKEPLIVEAGGRGADSIMHITNALEIFNPTLLADSYRGASGIGPSMGGSTVSDWVSVKRAYDTRPQYSQYGFGYNTFRHAPPQQGLPKGEWSQTGFF